MSINDAKIQQEAYDDVGPNDDARPDNFEHPDLGVEEEVVEDIPDRNSYVYQNTSHSSCYEIE